MHGDIVQFVFSLIGHMLKSCGANDLRHAISMAADDINVVFYAHNDVVRSIQRGEHHYYHVNTGDPYMSDNQCVLLGMLDESVIYKRIDEHMMVDMDIYPASVVPSNL